MTNTQAIAKRMMELSDALWNLACDLEDEEFKRQIAEMKDRVGKEVV
jgi:hypothetical protein